MHNRLEYMRLIGVDIDEAMECVGGNIDLYMGLIKKFIIDSDIDKLEMGIMEDNCKKAFEAAHSLKGMAANLCINPIYTILAEMVEILRIGSIKGVRELYARFVYTKNELEDIVKN